MYLLDRQLCRAEVNIHTYDNRQCDALLHTWAYPSSKSESDQSGISLGFITQEPRWVE